MAGGSSGPNYTQSAEPSQQGTQILGPLPPPVPPMFQGPQSPFMPPMFGGAGWLQDPSLDPIIQQAQMAQMGAPMQPGMGQLGQPPDLSAMMFNPMAQQLAPGVAPTPPMPPQQPMPMQQQAPPQMAGPQPQQNMSMAGPTPGARPFIDYTPAPPMQPNYPLGPPIPAQVDWNAIAQAQTHVSPLQKFLNFFQTWGDRWAAMPRDEAQAMMNEATLTMRNPVAGAELGMRYADQRQARAQQREMQAARMSDQDEIRMQRRIDSARGVLNTFDEETLAEYQAKYGYPSTEEAINAIPEYAVRAQRRKKYHDLRNQYLGQAARGTMKETDAKLIKDAKLNDDPDLIERVKEIRVHREEMDQARKDLADRLQKQRDALLDIAKQRLAQNDPRLKTVQSMIVARYQDYLTRARVPFSKAQSDLIAAFDVYGSRDTLLQGFESITSDADSYFNDVSSGVLGGMLLGLSGGKGENAPSANNPPGEKLDLTHHPARGGKSSKYDALIRSILGRGE